MNNQSSKPLVIDACGKPCPKPLIMTRKALKKVAEESSSVPLEIRVDNETARENLSRFLEDNQYPFNIKKEGEYSALMVDTSKISDLTDGKGAAYFSSFGETPAPSPGLSPSENKDGAGGKVICYKNNRMGNGPDELTSLLIQAHINTIEACPLPDALIFYGAGVKLTVDTSPVYKTLKKLLQNGVDILICGTCLDFFNLKNQKPAGRVSNMYDISARLLNAGSVIYP